MEVQNIETRGELEEAAKLLYGHPDAKVRVMLTEYAGRESGEHELKIDMVSRNEAGDLLLSVSRYR